MSARGWLLRIVAGGSLVRDVEQVRAEHEAWKAERAEELAKRARCTGRCAPWTAGVYWPCTCDERGLR